MSRANLIWLIPAGFMNPSRRFSPGDIGSNLAICLTPMVVLYFNVEERLANIISTGIAPPLMPAIEVLPWRNIAVIAVEVFPSYSRPHFLVSACMEEGTYIRVGH